MTSLRWFCIVIKSIRIPTNILLLVLCSLSCIYAENQIGDGFSAAPDEYANLSQHDNSSQEENDHGVHRYKVASFDIETVATPFTITLCILIASLAKIGTY